MRRALMMGGAFAALLTTAAQANMVQAPHNAPPPPLTVTVSPTTGSVPINAAAGTVVATATASAPATFDINPKTDFVMNGDQVVVGPNGINQSECTSSTPAGQVCTTDNTTITATSVNISPDGTTSTAPSGPTLTTASGPWTWGPSCSGTFYETLLNGSWAGGGCGSENIVANGGQMYNKGTDGNWWLYNPSTGGWTSTGSSTTP